ncbi:BhlA/UviB family holin-like peptide [Bacillus haynesii]|uniref:BhlA/UviB family holin-like peptide n=1 Tax=Bacillus haynesii TaxID=1925021 RepID=UPI00227DE349|nr:BhlA/UviB family holin-like peptide [Bacillus haynesii]MCY8048439.1 BhlA/UviB family holin-like peptide [Bacillus haynesii]MCY8668777.1 BhlA/UviB family holin-like peptide [Bacillus haynesii]MCY9324085.1 BhlA/UviB family holin-like peptide [Bacillus haynesii]
MEQSIINALLSKDTVFAVLFIWLFFRQIRQSEERENKLYTFLDNMKEEFAKLVKHYQRLSNDVEDIKEELKVHKGEK